MKTTKIYDNDSQCRAAGGRSSGADEALRLEPVKPLTLEESLEFLSDDELLEVTPVSLRIRKKILDHTQRGRADFKKKQGE